MEDMENFDDEKISKCLQEAFGYLDEQLLNQLDQVREELKDISFAGAEERLMKRFMERKAEMEKEALNLISEFVEAESFLETEQSIEE